MGNEIGHTGNTKCGLYMTESQNVKNGKLCPLENVDINVTVRPDFSSQVEIQQTFKITEETEGDVAPKMLVEGAYYFPLDGNAAVYAFEARFEDGTVVRGDCQEEKKAKQTFETAKKAGKTAFLMEREASDVFQMSLGNMPVNEVVVITIKFVAEVPMDGDRIRLRIPNRIAPKCFGHAGTVVDYPINFDFSIRTSSPIGEIKTLSGGVHLDITPSPGDNRHVRVKAVKEGFMNEDLVLLIAQQNPFGVHTTFERSVTQNSECLRLTWNTKENLQTSLEGACEIVFLVDRSGSMYGNRLKSAKSALTMFLRSLPVNSMFNIVQFDDKYEKCFSKSVRYGEETLKRAQNFVDVMEDRGCTDILTPLRDVLNAPKHDGYTRNVILLTDGEVGNTNSCIGVAAKGNARVFTIGVGKDFSQDLVEGIADASNAMWEAVKDTNDMGTKVMRILQGCLKPVIVRCKVDLGPFTGKTVMYPSAFPKLYDGQRTTISWLRSTEGQEYAPLPPKFEIQLTGRYNTGEAFSKTLQVVLEEGEGVTEEESGRSMKTIDSISHRCAAMARIKKLENSSSSDRKDAEVRALGLKYNLATSQTSFVAVREEVEGEADVLHMEEPELIEVANEQFLCDEDDDLDFDDDCDDDCWGADVGNYFDFSAEPAQAVPLCAMRDISPSPSPKRKTKCLPSFAPPSFQYETDSAQAPQYSRSFEPLQDSYGASSCSSFDLQAEIARLQREKERQAEIARLQRQEEEFKWVTANASMQRQRTRSLDKEEANLLMMKKQKANAKKMQRECAEECLDDRYEDEEYERLQDKGQLAINEFLNFEDDSDEEEEEVLAAYAAPKTGASTGLGWKPAPARFAVDYLWLITQQAFDGHFDLQVDSGSFAKYAPLVALLREQLAPCRNQDVLNRVLATLLAMALLTREFGDKKGEWMLVREKAKRYVTQALCGGASGINAADLFTITE